MAPIRKPATASPSARSALHGAEGHEALCVGARTEAGTASAQLLAHALAHEGLAARSLPAIAIDVDRRAEFAHEPAVDCSDRP